MHRDTPHSECSILHPDVVYLFRERDALRRIASILEHWDRDQRTDWAERTTNTRYGDWVTVEDTKTPIAHLKLLCHAEAGTRPLRLMTTTKGMYQLT